MSKTLPKYCAIPIKLSNREEARLREMFKDNPEDLEEVMKEARLLPSNFIQEFLDEFDMISIEFDTFGIG